MTQVLTIRCATLVAGLVLLASGNARAQIQLLPAPGFGSGLDVVCIDQGTLFPSGSADACTAGNLDFTQLAIGAPGNDILLDATAGATFNAPANFHGTTQFSGLQAFSGTTTLNGTVTVNNTLNTNGISNTGSISSNSIFGDSSTITNMLSANGTFTDSLLVVSTANIAMGGNQVHGVAAGTAATDAVNVGQLNAATSGITTNITNLTNTVTAQGTAITDIQAVNTTQDTRLTAVETVNTAQNTRLNAVEAVNSAQDTRLTAVETVNTAQNTRLNAVEAVNSAQDTRLTAVETVNTTQNTRLTAVETVNGMQASQISAIEAVNVTQASQIGSLQAAQDLLSGQVDTLFDLRHSDRRDMKQGVASAMSMAQAPMPSAPGRVAYAFNGAMFRGEYAVGGSLTYRLRTEAPFAVNVGASFAGNKNNGVRVGVAGEF